MNKGLGSFNTTGTYLPSPLLSDADRQIRVNQPYGDAPLAPVQIPGQEAFFRYIRGLEGSHGSYDAEKGDAIGAYQFRPPALKALGYLDENGNWAGKDGIYSAQQFRDSPSIQDKAAVAYGEVLRAELKANGAWNRIGDSLPDGTILTEGSLLGAGWLGGARSVANYLASDGSSNRTDANGASVGYRLRSFSRFSPDTLSDGAKASANAGSETSGPGHWEDQTITDAMGGVYGGTQRTWVPDTPSGAASPASASRPIGPVRSTGADAPAPPHQGNPADYSRNVQVKVGADGTIYRSSEATQDAPNGAYKRGDILVMQTDAQGRVLYQSIRHVENGITTLHETERDPVTGEVTVTWTDSTLIDGVRFTRDHSQQGAWLDARGRTVDEVQALASQQEADRLLARYPAPQAPTVADGAPDGPSDPPSPAPAPASSSAPATAAPAPAPASALDADPDAIHAITGWRPDTGPAGPALAAGTGGILTDAGLQHPGALPTIPLPVDSRDPTDPSSAFAINGSDFESDRAMDKSKLGQMQGDMGLFSSLLNWDQQSDLGHVQTALALYNRLNTGGSGVDLAGVASGLGLISSGLSLADALKSGDLKAIAGAGASFGSNAIQAYSAF
ncbi:MAG: hypothetical protein EKK53_21050, partial [Burkholderiales bacterium]